MHIFIIAESHPPWNPYFALGKFSASLTFAAHSDLQSDANELIYQVHFYGHIWMAFELAYLMSTRNGQTLSEIKEHVLMIKLV